MRTLTFILQASLLSVAFLCPAGLHAQNVRQELQEVKATQNDFLQTQVDERVTKIVNTPDFVRAANVSLNALVLSNSLTDYLNDVSNLNNPTNDDLGFSLTHRVADMMKQHIFPGKQKKGFARVMEITRSIIEHPLVSNLASAIPVVNSLGSVMNLVNNVVVQKQDVPIEDANKFREEIAKYVRHYQDLSEATRKFQGTVSAVQERTAELQLILKSFTTQRIGNLFPADAENAAAEASLRNVLLHVYEKERVVDTVASIISRYKQADEPNLSQVLTDPHLVYPDYVVNEARFMLDEMTAITQEYLIAFNEYQQDLETILRQSKDLGDAEKIDRKIALLQEKLQKVEAAFLNAVHVEEVEYRFRALAKTRINNR